MKTPNPTPLNLKLATGTDVAFVAATAATEPRRFSGIANSGRPFVLGDINMVVDFEGIQYKTKTAVLVDHSGGRIAGVAELSVTADGLLASGTLLGNEHGQAVAAASDEGFPWEMSAYVLAARYEELLSGVTATVNGREVSGPMLIMRDCTIREVSFTAVGVDANTSAVALSDGSPFNFTPTQSKQEHLSMTPDEQKELADLKKQVADLTAENAQLKKDKGKANVNAKLSAAGFKANADGKGFDGVSQATYNMLLSATDEDMAAIVADMQPKADPSKPAPPPALLSDTTPEAPADGVKLSAIGAAALQMSKGKEQNYV